VLSTDDDEIAQIGRQLGLHVPFLRPADLAEDTTPTFPVVIHALETLGNAGEHFDAVCLLQPTNPLRRPEDIDGCIELLESTQADAVVTVRRVPDEYNPSWVFWKDDKGKMSLSTGDIVPISRRQDLKPAYHRDGSVYVSRCDSLKSSGNLYGNDVRGYETLQTEYVNIDTQDDWVVASALMEQRLPDHLRG
jgi:CMP-N-acetylneuraminic acid synthetase